MADHEVEVAAKFGLPEFAGFAARIEARYKQSWTTRGTEVLTAAADTAGLEPAELGRALEDNEPASDVLHLALNRAVEVSDVQYISALGRLVGQALDPARIDEAAYLTSELVRLEPVHLRVLLMVFVFLNEGQYVDDPTLATVAAAADVQSTPTRISVVDVAERLGLTEVAATRVVDRLAADGLVLRGGGLTEAGQPSLMATEWAGRALILMFPKLTEIWLGGENYARP